MSFGPSFFVPPESVILNLPGGNWMEVKKRLNVGEARRSYKEIVGEINRDGWQRPNIELVGIAEVLCYIIDWGGDGFRDPEGRPQKPTLAAIQAMGIPAFDLIEKTIKAHIEAMEQEALEEKKPQDMPTESEQT